MTSENKGIAIGLSAILFMPTAILIGILIHFSLNKNMLESGYVKNTRGNWVPESMYCNPYAE